VAFTGNSQHISSASDSRSGAVNGARSDQTNVTLDGVDNNDQTLGTAFQGALRVPLDSLQEFKVTTASSDADSGVLRADRFLLSLSPAQTHFTAEPTSTIAAESARQ